MTGSRERVERALLGRIASGELKPGDRVPSRPALAAEYGVSFATLTAALGSLRVRGAIRRAHGGDGRGYYVCELGAMARARASPGREQLTQALRWAWARAYKISGSADGRLQARRLDGLGSVYGDGPQELRDAITEDYGRRPVMLP